MATPEPRPANRSDLATVVQCTCAAYEKFVARLGYEPKPMGTDYSGWIDEGWVWIIERDQGAIGTLVLLPENERLLIYSVAVAPEHQGQGHGRALMAFAEARARRLGASRIVLYTNEKMTENIQFYGALGYARYDRQPHPRVAGSWVIYMEKTVSPE
jgi:GNAT superfamily N-acetyltransferase